MRFIMTPWGTLERIQDASDSTLEAIKEFNRELRDWRDDMPLATEWE